jgi:putative aminopeptidase FrvX
MAKSANVKTECRPCGREISTDRKGNVAPHKVGNEGGTVTAYLAPTDRCPGSGTRG